MTMLHKMITLRQLSTYWIQISILCLFSSILHAQQFDQSYQSWKTQQQSHDQRLKASSSTADYYLGKPSLQNTSATSKQSSSKNNSSKDLGSKINLNTASTQELQQLNGIGEKKAQAIVDYRNQNGQFRSVNDLLNIKGIGPKFIEKNKSNLGL